MLSEALCGYKFVVPHLDGRQLLVSSNEGDIVKPGAFKVVYDEGMPHLHRSLDKGRLFIHFEVKFPEPGELSDTDVAVRGARPGVRTHRGGSVAQLHSLARRPASTMNHSQRGRERCTRRCRVPASAPSASY